MDNEQMYVFVDKSGHCFDDFEKSDESDAWIRYSQIVVGWFRNNRHFSVGDTMAFKNELEDAGFVWAKDFYIKKV